MSVRSKLLTHDCFRTSDGLYQSYWSGKLSSILMNNGHRGRIDRGMKDAYIYVKISSGAFPLEWHLESLEIIKPLFTTKSRVASKRRKKREYPIFLEPSKRLRLATRWLAEFIEARKERHLSHRIYSELNNIRSSKKHPLTKRRDLFFALAVKNRFNTRFSF